MDQDPLSSKKTVGLVLNVHRDTSLGMLESLYEHSFALELIDDGLVHEQQAKMPVSPRAEKVKQDYRIDVLINGKMAVELKGIV